MNLYDIASGIIKKADSDKSWLPYISAYLGGNAAVSAGNAIWSNKVMPSIIKEDSDLYRKLADYGLKNNLVKDILEGDVGSSFMKGKNTMYNFGAGNPFTKTRNAYFNLMDKKLHGEQLYNELNGTIMNAGLKNRAGTLAHELGHAMDYANRGNYLKSYTVGKIGGLGVAPLISAATALSGADDNTVLATGFGGTLLSAPMHRAELNASMNGYKLLRKFGKSKLGALAAFAGYPTYLASTLGLNLTPWIARKIGNAYNS